MAEPATHPVTKRTETFEQFASLAPTTQHWRRTSPNIGGGSHFCYFSRPPYVFKRSDIGTRTLELLLQFGYVIFREGITRGREIEHQNKPQLVEGCEGTICSGGTQCFQYRCDRLWVVSAMPWLKFESPTCFEMASSVLNNSSKPRFFICSSKAVAIFMWVSRVAFRAVNSGNCVIAVLR